MLGSLYSKAIRFATEKDQNQSNANPLVAVNKGFQQSVSAMFPTVSAQQNSSVTLSDLEVFSHSKTFAVIKDIDIYVKNIDEFRKLFDLCQPLFSDLLHLTLILDFPFDHGNEVADFIFRFRALKTLMVVSDPGRSFLPEVFTFFNKLFDTPNISRFVMYVDLFASFLCDHEFAHPYSQQAPEFHARMHRHQIRPFLIRKMIEVYGKERRKGESIVFFVNALVHSLQALRDDPTVDSRALLSELKPCLDFIKPLILNNDLLKDCYVPTLDALRFDNFSFTATVSAFFSVITDVSRVSTLQLMKQYGRELVPVLADSVFSISDVGRSRGAFSSVAAIIRLFSNTVPDYFWTDELTESSNIEDFKRVEKKGFKFLQHVPFDKCAIAIKDFINCTCDLQHDNDAHSVLVFSYFFRKLLVNITIYVNGLARLGDTDFANNVAQDVSTRMNEHRILPALFSCIKKLFERNEKSADPKLPISFHIDHLVDGLKEMLCHSGTRATSSFNECNADALFGGGDDGIDQIVDIWNRACKKYKEEVDDFRKDLSEWNDQTDVAEMKKKQVALVETRKFVSNLSDIVCSTDQVVIANITRFSNSCDEYWTLKEKQAKIVLALCNARRLNATVDRKLDDLRKKLNERDSE